MSLSQRLAKIREAEAEFHRELQKQMRWHRLFDCGYCGQRHLHTTPREWREN